MKYKSKICYFRVARKVAFDFQSNVPTNYGMHEKKQIPCVMNMLTRDLILPRKGPVNRKSPGNRPKVTLNNIKISRIIHKIR